MKQRVKREMKPVRVVASTPTRESSQPIKAKRMETLTRESPVPM
jgi:hypothetical protein